MREGLQYTKTHLLLCAIKFEMIPTFSGGVCSEYSSNIIYHFSWVSWCWRHHWGSKLLALTGMMILSCVLPLTFLRLRDANVHHVSHCYSLHVVTVLCLCSTLWSRRSQFNNFLILTWPKAVTYYCHCCSACSFDYLLSYCSVLLAWPKPLWETVTCPRESVVISSLNYNSLGMSFLVLSVSKARQVCLFLQFTCKCKCKCSQLWDKNQE